MENTIIVVNKEPYCVWEHSVRQRNVEFLEGVDAEYFNYLLECLTDGDDDQRSSIALRLALHHAEETMFSLLGALIQAPNCAYAWMAKYSNEDLRDVVREICSGRSSLHHRLSAKELTWESIANAVFSSYMPETERQKETASGFGRFWGMVAHQYLKPERKLEYNSLKHGFRVKTGGFFLSVGVEHEYGVAPPDNEMQVIGGSKDGLSFFALEPAISTPKTRSLRSKRHSINWTIERVMFQMQLIGMSIQNIKSALLIANGVPVSECKFVRPSGNEDFDKPWQYSTGITNCSMDFVMPEDQVVHVTKQDLLDELKKLRKES